jgi:hypothetical protein
MKAWIPFAFLFAIVFVAGCTIPGLTTSSGYGVTVKSFSLSDSTVEPNTPILLSLILQNSGGAKATNIHAELGGLTQDWSIDGGRGRNYADLDPPDTARGITTGGTDEQDWTLSAPGLSSQFNYPLSVQISYNYETTSDNLIRATSFDYYKTNKPTTGVVESKTTGGPISVTLTAPNAVFAGSSVPVYVEFHNVGSGRVKDDTLGVDIQGSGVGCKKSSVKLIEGKDGYLRCDASTGGVTTFIDFRVSIHSSYTYQITASNSITVQPKPV